MLIRSAPFVSMSAALERVDVLKTLPGIHLLILPEVSWSMHIHRIAPHPLVPFFNVMPRSSYWKKAECPLCLNLLNSPIELVTCGSILRSQCCSSWLQVYGGHLNDIKTIRQECYLVQDMLKAILILCSKCDRKVHLTKYAAHLESGCSYVPVDPAIQCILDQPIDEPLSHIENT